ncbi:MAG: hypothetical protein JST59_29515 [Actinobacteria bacterium]|nr:hypothetical protein [Actinomycetota bacterium]
MKLAPIKARDIVLADVRGDRFYGLVTGPAEMDEVLRRRVLTVASLTGRPIPTHRLSATQVIAHYRRAAGSRD